MWQLEIAATSAASGSTRAGSPLYSGAAEAGTSSPPREPPRMVPRVALVRELVVPAAANRPPRDAPTPTTLLASGDVPFFLLFSRKARKRNVP